MNFTVLWKSTVTLILCLIYSTSFCQKTNICLGAYYFDGWTGKTPQTYSKLLSDSFSSREPLWGWITSKPEIVKAQIDLAANSGLSFFDFCWYYPNNNKINFKKDYLNNALNLYLIAPNKKRLKFCILVANHEGYVIGPEDWTILSKAWIDLFKNQTYLRINNKPFITFLNVSSLLRSFGSTKAVKKAFEKLRHCAKMAGFSGVTIAACAWPGPETIRTAENCGFDLLTGYNYQEAGFKSKEAVVPIENLILTSPKVWDFFKESSLPYIPVATLNWDNRPWSKIPSSPHYVGFSSTSVYNAILSLKTWINNNAKYTTAEKVALVFAWNEYGEGAWLTPSKREDLKLLNGIKKALVKKVL